MCPASAMHGPHHVAQKSISTSLPFRESLLTVFPSSVANEYFGESPTFTAAGADAAQTIDATTARTNGYAVCLMRDLTGKGCAADESFSHPRNGRVKRL